MTYSPDSAAAVAVAVSVALTVVASTLPLPAEVDRPPPPPAAEVVVEVMLPALPAYLTGLEDNYCCIKCSVALQSAVNLKLNQNSAIQYTY